MQVSTQTRHLPSGRLRSPASDPVATITAAVGLSAGRDGGQHGWSARDERQTTPDRVTTKTGHKTVFVARALSSTLNQLQIASGAGEFEAMVSRAEASAPKQTGSLDDLLSNLLSAA